MLRIALIVEDRGLQRPRDLGENPRRDRRGEMAEKQCLHLPLPFATHRQSAIVCVFTPPRQMVWKRRSGAAGSLLASTLYIAAASIVAAMDRRASGTTHSPRLEFSALRPLIWMGLG